ncbi:MAG: hypothetical protein AAGB28_08490 [Pseudomonadota bacterium]
MRSINPDEQIEALLVNHIAATVSKRFVGGVDMRETGAHLTLLSALFKLA